MIHNIDESAHRIHWIARRSHGSDRVDTTTADCMEQAITPGYRPENSEHHTVRAVHLVCVRIPETSMGAVSEQSDQWNAGHQHHLPGHQTPV